MWQIHLKNLGLVEYQPTFDAMQNYTQARHANRADYGDEIWNLQHPPVYTQGLAGKREHILNAGNIPVIQVNRGGQVTYHGPGQVVLYFLLDIARQKLGTRVLVEKLEAGMIDFLAQYQIQANGNRDAPGVYVAGAKIGSIGLRVSHGLTYHGISFNINNDLTPFAGINPCGFANLPITRLGNLCDLRAHFGSDDASVVEPIGAALAACMCRQLGATL